MVRVCVAEGDYVEQGDTLAILSSPELNATQEGATAKWQESEAQDALVREGARQEVICSAHARWQ